MPLPYEVITYPSSPDFFQEVADGTSPENKIHARYINKVQNAIVAVERNIQYTVITPYATGGVSYVQKLVHTVRSNPERRGLSFAMSVDPAIATGYFGNNPFSGGNVVRASCLAYKIVGGARSYYITRTGVNAKDLVGNLLCYVIGLKTQGDWRAGDVAEITLTIEKA